MQVEATLITYFCENITLLTDLFPEIWVGTWWNLKTTTSKGETIFWSNFVEFHIGFGVEWQIQETFMFAFRYSNMLAGKSTRWT